MTDTIQSSTPFTVFTSPTEWTSIEGQAFALWFGKHAKTYVEKYHFHQFTPTDMYMAFCAGADFHSQLDVPVRLTYNDADRRIEDPDRRTGEPQ